MKKQNMNSKNMKQDVKLTKEAIQKISMIPLLEWIRGKRQRLLAWGILYMILLGVLVTQIKLIHLTSESIPYKYCFQLNGVSPEKGDLCVFDYHSKSKNSKFTFVKYLVGVEGDKIKRMGEKIYINEEFVCEVNPASGLTPIEDSVIPPGRVFVVGTHKDSLDSRYEEFGLIKVSDLKGKAFGWVERQFGDK